MEEEMSKVGNLYLCTDDGSYGFKGVGTAMLEKLVSEGHHYDLCVAIGPMIMMKFACLTTKKLGYSDRCQHEPDHGRRNRYVRSLSCDGRRRGEVCMCRRTGV